MLTVGEEGREWEFVCEREGVCVRGSWCVRGREREREIEKFVCIIIPTISRVYIPFIGNTAAMLAAMKGSLMTLTILSFDSHLNVTLENKKSETLLHLIAGVPIAHAGNDVRRFTFFLFFFFFFFFLFRVKFV